MGVEQKANETMEKHHSCDTSERSINSKYLLSYHVVCQVALECSALVIELMAAKMRLLLKLLTSGHPLRFCCERVFFLVVQSRIGNPSDIQKNGNFREFIPPCSTGAWWDFRPMYFSNFH